jgi:FkbM family methyltransferase
MELFATLRNLPQKGDIFEGILEGLYRRVLSGWSVALDGGANHGRHTIPMAQMAWRGRVLAFEPIPVVVGRLQERINSSEVAARVVVRQAALGSCNGSTEFFVVDESPDPNFPFAGYALSGIRLGEEARELKHRRVSVEVTSIDSEWELHHLGRVDFIKLDLEGGEYHALQGAEKVLRRDRPMVVFEDGGPFTGTKYGYDPRMLLSYLRG